MAMLKITSYPSDPIEIIVMPGILRRFTLDTWAVLLALLAAALVRLGLLKVVPW
jgi:hypothetical protein